MGRAPERENLLTGVYQKIGELDIFKLKVGIVNFQRGYDAISRSLSFLSPYSQAEIIFHPSAASLTPFLLSRSTFRDSFQTN
jgi:hypothetical protein